MNEERPREAVETLSSATTAGTGRLRSLLLTTAVALIVTVGGWQLLSREQISLSDIPTPPARATAAVSELLQHQYAALTESPSKADLWGNYAMGLMQHEFFSEALICFGTAEKLDTNDPRWPYLSGVILEQQSTEQALLAFRRSFGKRPTNVPTRLRVISAEIALGNLEVAAKEISDVLNSFPGQQQAWLLRLQLMRLQGAEADSLDIIRRASEVGANSRELLLEASRLALMQRHTNAVALLTEQAKQVAPMSNAADPWMDLVRTFDASGAIAAIEADRMRAEGRIAAAKDKLISLVSSQPDQSRPALNLALSLLDEGRVAEASLQLQDLRERFPSDPLIRFHTGVLFSQQNRVEEALQELEQCLHFKPDYGAARSLSGWLRQQQGDHEQALREYQRAIIDEPASIPIRVMCLELLRALDREEEHRQLLQDSAPLFMTEASADDPELQKYRQQLVDLQTSANEPDSSVSPDTENGDD